MMRKNKFSSLLSLLLIAALCVSLLSLTGCAAILNVNPIFTDEAEAISESLDLALGKKANALDALARGYEASGEIIKDQDGENIDMAAYIAELKADAAALRTLTYEAYALAIMDDLYSREYIGVYRSVLSLIPTMVDHMAEDVMLEKVTDKEKGTDALIACYVLALGDIYAGYVDEQTANQEKEMPTSYVGIGVSVTPRNDGYIDIISVTRDSPAEKAGIIPGDVLTAVNGEDISDMEYNQVVLLVRGDVGTSITMTFSRGGTPYTVTLTRAVVDSVTVEHKLLTTGTGKTGYLRINSFGVGTFEEFVEAIDILEAAGATEFVFDVRNNPGGNAEAVIAILEYILPDDIAHPIVRFEYTDTSEEFYTVEAYLKSVSASADTLAKYEAAKNHTLNARLAVLCNQYTASAGELFTSCLKDFGYAEIYGIQTYGKGLGQTSYRVTDYYAYSALGYQYATYFKMAYFVIPSFYYSPPVSDNYHGIGVVPHHTIELSEEAKEYYLTILPEELDNQLQAAIAFLQSDTPPSPSPSDPPEGDTGTGDTGNPEQNPGDTGTGDTGNPQDPPREYPQDNSDLILFVMLAFFAGAAIALVIYIVIDYRKRTSRVSKPYSPPHDGDEDH